MINGNTIQLNESIGVFEIKTRADFDALLRFEKAIVYLEVEWSGPERIARSMVFTILNDLKPNALTSNATPFFKIDCSDEPDEYIRNWFDSQTKNKYLYSHGYGELLLVRNGIITQLERHPQKLGTANLKHLLSEWLNPKS